MIVLVVILCVMSGAIALSNSVNNPKQIAVNATKITSEQWGVMAAGAFLVMVFWYEALEPLFYMVGEMLGWRNR